MDKRRQAVDETRQRIVDATVALHGEQGVDGTSWEDIARKADVALATVYRHFPTLNELVPACGQQVAGIIRPPTLQSVRKTIGDVPDQTSRVGLMVQEIYEFYDRGSVFFAVALRDANQVQALAEWFKAWDAAREEIVTGVLEIDRANNASVPTILAFTDFRVWQSLDDQDVATGEAVDKVSALVMRLLAESPAASSHQET